MPSLANRIWPRVVREARKSARRAGAVVDRLIDPDDSITPLIDAARAGDVELLERLLVAGADADQRDRSGKTALHHAVANGRYEAAACLLSYGASHRIADYLGRQPLAPTFTDPETLHAIRQRHQRFRKQAGERALPESSEVRSWLACLEQNGVVRVSGLMTPEVLAQLRHDFARFIDNVDDRLGRGEGLYHGYFEEEHYWNDDRAYVSNNAFKYSPSLVRLCCSEPILQLVEHYMGRHAFISRGVAMRYLPTEERQNDMFGWHHDLEDKRLKMMVLLTDVDEGDQCMSYVLGSHKLFHPLDMFRRNACSLDYCRQHMADVKVFHTLGRAGDLFLFDPNGAHRGNRRPDAKIRDAFFVEYTTDTSNLWGTDLDPRTFDGMSVEGRNPFELLMKADKKWARRTAQKAPSWMENLEKVDSWL